MEEIDIDESLCDYIPDEIHEMFGEADTPQHKLLEMLWINSNHVSMQLEIAIQAVQFLAKTTGNEEALDTYMMSVLQHPSMQEPEPEPEPTSPPKLHIVGDLEDKE